MNDDRTLPVLMPEMTGQHWSCHSCGDCCRTLVGHLYPHELRRLDAQNWAAELGVAPYIRRGLGGILNQRPDGSCVFLDENNRCRIHARHGESAKPLACRMFPFAVYPVSEGWRASLRFDCPSVVRNRGAPLLHHRADLEALVSALHHVSPDSDDFGNLSKGLPAFSGEIDSVVRHVTRWFSRNDIPITTRLVGGARLVTTLHQSRLLNVRGVRFNEFVELLVNALPAEIGCPTTPTPRQRALLRQFAFAHAEHLSFRERYGLARVRIMKRFQQFVHARRYLRGRGLVPPLPELTGTPEFSRVESVHPIEDNDRTTEDLLVRYLTGRFTSRTFHGPGYYGWSMVPGLAALFLSVGAAGWLARCVAAADSRNRLTFDDFARALGWVDRAATRVPVLGAFSERARIRHLLDNDGVVRLVARYAPIDQPTNGIAG